MPNKDPEKAKAYKRAYYLANREKLLAYHKAWSTANPDKRMAWRNRDIPAAIAKCKAWKQDNKARVDSTRKAWKLTNQDLVRITRRAYWAKRYATDPLFRLQHLLRGRFKLAVSKESRRGNCLKLIGMELQEYKIFLQGQFRDGMTWENQGTIWEIDHIRPCASFDLTCPEQQAECFAWHNTQPLLCNENRSKGATYSPAPC